MSPLNRLVHLGAVLVLLGGCTATTGPRPRAASPSPATPTGSPAGAATASTVPGAAFDLDWDDSDFGIVACPDDHPTASCYGGSAVATLPVVGALTLRRTVWAGDAPRSAPPGCITADTDGTLTAPSGSLPIHGTGSLCGALASYALTSGTGTGTLAGVTIHAQVTNNSGAEHWKGVINRSAP
jgi:hypothetical protein